MSNDTEPIRILTAGAYLGRADCKPPGNIRELQNFIERAVVMSPGSVLRPPLAELKQTTKQQPLALSRTLAAAEREHILEVLDQTAWLIGGQQGAAARLGLRRTTLIYKMRKLGIETRRLQRRRSMPFEPSFVTRGFSAAAAGAL